MSASLVSLASLLRTFDPVTPQVRLGAIIVREAQLLLVEHRKRAQRYWVLPGGRLEAGETMEAGLRRELREELGLEARVGPLLIVGEILAPDRHTVNLIYRADVAEPAEPRLDPTDTVLAGWQWVGPDRLTELDLRPPIAATIRAIMAEQLGGSVRVLGDTWTAGNG